MAYQIIVKPSAQRDLNLYPVREVQRISGRISHLANGPRPFGSQKLSGENSYRLRVGSYRVLYEVDDGRKVIYIYRIKHRKDAYK